MNKFLYSAFYSIINDIKREKTGNEHMNFLLDKKKNIVQKYLHLNYFIKIKVLIEKISKNK